MLEISMFFSKTERRYILAIGHGGPRYGQTALITFVKEYTNEGLPEFAEVMFSLGG